jgi:pimeloyl-ACP methyl ester carboxylesterase
MSARGTSGIPEECPMPILTVGEENAMPITLHYEDHGTGRPVVLIHGWPLSGRSWEKQVEPLIGAGHRVITYDRRGFGQSSQPWSGYDYDTLAADLHTVVTKLDLRDVALVGFSMGGGEVARYIGTHGTDRISAAALVSAVPPFLLKAKDNPEGVDVSVFDGIRAGLSRDRLAYLTTFMENFYNADELKGDRVSGEVIWHSWAIAAGASPRATIELVAAWGTDFRGDLARFDLPTLVVHGDADRIVPIAASGKRTSQMVKGSRLVVIEGAPHGLNWTHAEELNRALVEFLASAKPRVRRAGA